MILLQTNYIIYIEDQNIFDFKFSHSSVFTPRGEFQRKNHREMRQQTVPKQ